MELVDSSLGMMYGTILSPLLLGFGFEPIFVIPSILFAQSIGGIGGTISHHYHKNADFNGFTKDLKVVMAMVIPGMFAVVFGVFLGIVLPIIIVKAYISILVIIMSILCLTTLKFKFSWWKHIIMGILAAFNKALSGGGFGPVTSTGGIIGGLDSKTSIATTTFSEVFICFSAFVLYIVFARQIDLTLLLSLSVGALFGGLIGPRLITRIKSGRLRKIIGVLGILAGLWLSYKILFS